MNMLKILYILLYLLAVMPVLGYIRYLYNIKGNRRGAVAVFIIAILTGIGTLQVNS